MTNISSTEFALWAIFLSINSFMILIDFGYGATFSRFIMYAYSGSENIRDPYINSKKNELANPNLKLLSMIIISTQKVYKKLMLISFGILLILSLYIFFIIFKENQDISYFKSISSWFIFFISILITISSMKDAAIMKGLNKVYELQKITIINSILIMILKICFLLLGLGILGLAIANLTTVLLLKIQYKKSLKEVFLENEANLKEAKIGFHEKFYEDYKFIKEKSRGMGGTLISQFLQTQFIVFLLPLFLGLKVISEFTLSYQLITTIGSVSSILFSVYYIKLGNAIVTRNYKLSSRIYKKTFTTFVGSYFVFSLLLILKGKEVLTFLKSNLDILPQNDLILLVLYVFVYQMIQRSTSIIALSNNQKFVKSLLLFSFISSIGMIVLLYFNFEITYVLVWIILLQVSYNLWKWLIESYKMCSKLKDQEIYKIS